VTIILGGDSHSHFSPLRDKEFLVSPYFQDTPTPHECGGRSPRRRTRATVDSDILIKKRIKNVKNNYNNDNFQVCFAIHESE
jgi:hypothetical protein